MREWLKKYDVITKALAVLISVVLWIYVVNVVDPTAEIEVRGIRPTYIGSEELLKAKSLIVSNEQENLITVKLSGKRRSLAAINKNDVHIEVDLSKIKEAGSYKLAYNVIVPASDVSVVNRNPDPLTIKMDKIVTATVPIHVKLEGSIAEGYMSGDITTVPSSLSVIGVADEINQISYAQVKIAKNDINTSIIEQMRYEFYNSKDRMLNLHSIKAENNTVEVSVPIFKLKDLPLSVEIVEGGGALKKNVNYTIEPKHISVAGDERTIDALQSLMVGVIDLSKISDNTKIPIKLTLPDNIKNTSGETTATVNIEFNGLDKKIIETSSIEITNIPMGYKIEPITNSISVMLRGPADSIAKVLPQNIRAVVDLTSTVLTPGQHTIVAKINIDGVNNVGAVGEYKVVVKVSR